MQKYFFKTLSKDNLEDGKINKITSYIIICAHNFFERPVVLRTLSYLVITIISIISWYISYMKGLTVSYNDAMSHLDLSRLVVDNLQTGLSQLGSVWLPLNHILFLPLIWNNWAWHSGFAGSIVSMIAFIASGMGIYLTLWELTKSRLTSTVGSLAFVLNLNILYLQTTPLTEPLFLAFVILSVLYFIRFIKSNDSRYLLLLGFLGALLVLTRYDGWFVVTAEIVLLFYHQFFIAKNPFRKTFGKLFLFGFPSAFAAGLWLVWNWLIFGSPLYFAIGPYSAHAQQVDIAERGGLITKGNLLASLHFYGVDILANVGTYVGIISILGLIAFIVIKNAAFNWKLKSLIILLLLSPIIFNIISLYLGFSVLNLPQLHWNPNPDPSGQWFNVRYGIMALPIVAIAIGLLANLNRIVALLLILVIIGQGYLMYRGGIVTVLDGTIGSSSFTNADIALALSNVKPNEKVVMSTSYFNAVAFRSGLDLHSIIHEGVSKEWNAALADPEDYAQWIVMANGSTGEPVYDSLVKKQQKGFLAYYKLFYKGNHADVYELKTPNEMYIRKGSNALLIGNHNYDVRPISDPDLAFKTQEEIIKSFEEYEGKGFNTVVFNAFGDGCPSGFQPQAGILNEDRLKNMDFILSISQQYKIRLVPVLMSGTSSCGGKEQYLKWIGQDPKNTDLFYIHPVAESLFQNYLNLMLSRKNTLTNRSYSEEPAILAWDVYNDPNAPTNLAKPWLGQMAEYLRSKDQNHLITAQIGNGPIIDQTLPENFLDNFQVN